MKINKNFYFFMTLLSGLAGAAAPVDFARAAAEQPEKPATAAAEAPAEEIDGQEISNYLSGQFARASGDFAVAIRHLRRVQASHPDNPEVATELQGMLLMQGQADEAVDMADKIHAADDRDALSSLMLALREIKRNHPEEAAKILDAASDNANGQLWLPLFTAWVDIERHKMDKPLTVAALGSEIGGAVPLVNYHLALINSAAGFKDEAVKNFKAAAQDAADAPPRIMQMMLAFYQQNGKPAELTPMVDAYLGAHPDSADAADTPSVRSMQDGVAEVLYTMGGIMLGAGISNDSVIYLQLAIYVKPDFADAQLALGDAYADLQQFGQANDSYARIPPASRLYGRAQIHIAINEDRMGKTKEALAMLDRLAAHSPRASDALVTKGDLLRIHGRYAEAVQAYTAAIKAIPQLKSDDWAILFARGSSYERQSKWPAAEKDLQAALELKPGQPDVLNYLGYGWLERGQHLAEARQMLEKAVKARPNDAQIVDSMGWALYQLEDYPAATGYLEKAVELLPGDPTVNDHLGDVYWRLGRKTEARYQWERSLTFSPEAALADSLHHKIKEGLPPALSKTAANQGASASATP